MKWFKRLLLAAALLLAFIVIAMIGVIVLVDPNDYRDEITAAVKRQTGRDMSIEGELGLSVFPWLGLELGRVRLDNPPGFTDETFASVERVNVKVALLPLLRLETRVGNLELDGLQVNLERRADGVTNWDDLVADEPAPAPGATAPAPEANEPPVDKSPAEQTVPQFYVGSLDITNTDISWRDAVAKVHTRVEDLNFNTGEILPLKAIPFTLEFGVRNESPKLLAGARLKGAARMDLAGEQYTLENLEFESEASGTLVPGGNQTLRMQLPRLALDRKAQTAELQQLKMQVAGLNLALDLKAESILEENPRFSGQLTADAVQLRNLLQSLGIEPPVTADPSTLSFFNAQLAFSGDANSLDMQNLKLSFDETNITGALAVRDFAAPAYQINLNVDRLNADRYLPPPEPAPAAPQGEQASEDVEIPLPVDDLRKLKAEGKLGFGDLQLMKLKLSNIQAGLTSAGDGIVRLEPLAVDLYGGNFKGALILDVTGKVPQYRINTELSQVQIEPLLFDYMESRFISGQMNAKFDISTAGDRLSHFKKNLSGLGNLDFRDGALSFDLREKAREAKAKLRRQAYNPPPPKPTTFSAITAGLNFNEGTVSNQDLEVRAGHLFITGGGQYALPSDAIDYVVTLLFSEDPLNQGDALKEFYGVPIKLHLKGPLATIDYLDVVRSGLSGAVSGKAKQQVEEKKQELKQEFKEKLEEKLPKEKRDELKQKLLKKLVD